MQNKSPLQLGVARFLVSSQSSLYYHFLKQAHCLLAYFVILLTGVKIPLLYKFFTIQNNATPLTTPFHRANIKNRKDQK